MRPLSGKRNVNVWSEIAPRWQGDQNEMRFDLRQALVTVFSRPLIQACTMRSSGALANVPPLSRDSRYRAGEERLRFLLNAPQVLAPAEAFCVKLVDLFCARGPRREPAALRRHLEAADRVPVAGRGGQHAGDGLAGELGRRDLARREPASVSDTQRVVR